MARNRYNRPKSHSDYQQYNLYSAESQWQNEVDPSQLREVTVEKVNEYGIREYETKTQYVNRFKSLAYDDAKAIADRIINDPWFRERCVEQVPAHTVSKETKCDGGSQQTPCEHGGGIYPHFAYKNERKPAGWANILDSWTVKHRKLRSDTKRWGGMVTWKPLGTAKTSGRVAELKLKHGTDITTILHELGHIMAGRHEHHGATFARCNVELVRHYIGKADAQKLEEVYAREGIEVEELLPYEQKHLEEASLEYEGAA